MVKTIYTFTHKIAMMIHLHSRYNYKQWRHRELKPQIQIQLMKQLPPPCFMMHFGLWGLERINSLEVQEILSWCAFFDEPPSDQSVEVLECHRNKKEELRYTKALSSSTIVCLVWQCPVATKTGSEIKVDMQIRLILALISEEGVNIVHIWGLNYRACHVSITNVGAREKWFTSWVQVAYLGMEVFGSFRMVMDMPH